MKANVIYYNGCFLKDLLQTLHMGDWVGRTFDFLETRRNYLASCLIIPGAALLIYSVNSYKNAETQESIARRYPTVSRALELERLLNTHVKRSDILNPEFVGQTRSMTGELEHLRSMPDFESQRSSYDNTVGVNREERNDYSGIGLLGGLLALLGAVSIKRSPGESSLNTSRQ